ncbi:hypothetical protein PGB90_010333 [Kerria lacca]
MNELMNNMKKKSQKRKRLLAQTFGVHNIKELHLALGRNIGINGRNTTKFKRSIKINSRSSLKEHLINGVLYKGSSTFLKGTRSSNPHNDYCQHFVDTGQRPQNFIRDVGLNDRFEEYPRLRELIKLKDEHVALTSTPPMYLKCDLRSYNLLDLNNKFDVILIEPPLEEYQRTIGATNLEFWSWDQVMNLNIGAVAAPRSFVFLWCGSSEGLDMGRSCLKKWGFRRCEDICWIRTNIGNPGHSKNLDSKAIFQRTKEHCLMGIKGTVRRSTDGDFIHANIDIDLIISEENECGSLEKPVEIFYIIEHFCLGRRRLHLFGRDSTIRPGWLTLGPEITNSNFNADVYSKYFTSSSITTGCTERIEALRPKSPVPKIKGNSNLRDSSSNADHAIEVSLLLQFRGKIR